MITIDGSYLEGGGQILRTSVALSAITRKSVCIDHIRQGRKQPGLKPQHLTALKAAAELCSAKLEGATLGSTKITFQPKKIKGGDYKFDIGTAGSITLALQGLIPISLCAGKPTNITIIGGTDVMGSPPIDYFQHVFCTYTNKFLGLKLWMNMKNRGFYPKGGGIVEFVVNPGKPKSINLLKQGRLEKIDLHAIATDNLENADVCNRMLCGFRSVCPEKNISEHIQYVKSLSTGAVLHAHAHYENCVLGASALGERGKPAESLGKECAAALSKEMKSKATVDCRMADQLMIFMALAAEQGTGSSVIRTSRISNHIKTNKHIIEMFLPVRFKIEGKVICQKVKK